MGNKTTAPRVAETTPTVQVAASCVIGHVASKRILCPLQLFLTVVHFCYVQRRLRGIISNRAHFRRRGRFLTRVGFLAITDRLVGIFCLHIIACVLNALALHLTLHLLAGLDRFPNPAITASYRSHKITRFNLLDQYGGNWSHTICLQFF